MYAEISDDDDNELDGLSSRTRTCRTLRSRTTAQTSPKAPARSSRTKVATSSPYARHAKKTTKCLASSDISPPMFVGSYTEWHGRAMVKGKGIKGKEFYTEERRAELLAEVKFVSRTSRGSFTWRCPCNEPLQREQEATRHIETCHLPPQPCIGVPVVNRHLYPELGPDAGSVLWTNEDGEVEVRVGGCGIEICNRNDARQRHTQNRGGLCVWPPKVSIPRTPRSRTRA